MAVKVNIDGQIGDGATAAVSVFDRGFLYGDSVYEVLRTYGGRPFALDEHLARLERSAAALLIELPARPWLVEQLGATIAASGNAECHCRLIVTRGSGPLTLDPTTASGPRTILIVKEYTPFADWMYERGIRVAVAGVRRTAPDALDPAIKSGNYLNNVLALGEARRAGYDDAILLDHAGRVTEATSSNVFAAVGGALLTPPLATGLLAGVTRGLVMRLAAQAGLPCREQDLRVADLIAADELVLTSTLREVMPVVALGEHPIAGGRPGPLAARLRALVQAHAWAATRPAAG